MINYIVDDMDALLDRLKQEGVKIDAKRMDESYGRFAWIYDLDGNKIELWQPLPAKPYYKGLPLHLLSHSFPHGRPHREVSFRRRCSLAFIISLKSATGRISIGPSPYLKPGCCETS